MGNYEAAIWNSKVDPEARTSVRHRVQSGPLRQVWRQEEGYHAARKVEFENLSVTAFDASAKELALYTVSGHALGTAYSAISSRSNLRETLPP